jgi:hypothetical protein
MSFIFKKMNLNNIYKELFYYFIMVMGLFSKIKNLGGKVLKRSGRFFEGNNFKSNGAVSPNRF